MIKWRMGRQAEKNSSDSAEFELSLVVLQCPDWLLAEDILEGVGHKARGENYANIIL